MSCPTYHPNIGPDCCVLPDVWKLGLGGTKELRGLQDVNSQADSCAGALGAMKTMSEKQKCKTQGHACGCWPCRSSSDRGRCDGLIGSKPSVYWLLWKKDVWVPIREGGRRQRGSWAEEGEDGGSMEGLQVKTFRLSCPPGNSRHFLLFTSFLFLSLPFIHFLSLPLTAFLFHTFDFVFIWHLMI